MTYAELKGLRLMLWALRDRAKGDHRIRSYLDMAIARIDMLCRRWDRRGTFAPDTHPKGARNVPPA